MVHTYKYTYVLCMYMITYTYVSIYPRLHLHFPLARLLPPPLPLLFSPEGGLKFKSCENSIGPKLH